jgi:hypothetical protein
VEEAERERATARLGSLGCAALSLDEASRLAWPKDLARGSKALGPFLVRGVSFGVPTFAAVRVSADHRSLHVHQATAEAEIWIPGKYPDPLQVRPLIVLLDREPDSVLPSADIGGDRIFRGWAGDRWKWRPADERRSAGSTSLVK